MGVLRSWSMRRAAGLFLVLGFLAMMIGVLLFLDRGGMLGGANARGPGSLIVERSSLMAAVIFTAIGFMVLERDLHNNEGRVLARVGATAYLLAGGLLVTAEALELSAGGEVYALIVVYIVLAFLAQTAIGGALLRSGLLPAWVGWIIIAWNLGWLVILPITAPGDMYYPILHHLMPLLMGLPLLWKN